MVAHQALLGFDHFHVIKLMNEKLKILRRDLYRAAGDGYLKEDLRQFWNQNSILAAERFLEDWCRRANASGIRVLQTIAKTLQLHRTGLLNW